MKAKSLSGNKFRGLKIGSKNDYIKSIAIAKKVTLKGKTIEQ